MKKTILMIASLVVVLALFFVFTGVVGDKDVSRTASAEESNTLIIGVYEPLTGIEAEGGKKELLGIQYANSVKPTVDVAGVTYNIELLELDNASDLETAKLDGKYFVKEGVTAVLGSYGTELSKAGAAALSESGVPLVQSVGTGSKADAEQSVTQFRVRYDDSFQAGVMANYAISKGFKTAVVLTQENNEYSAGMAELFTDEFIRREGNVFAYTYEQGQNNFKSISDMISSVKAQVVYLPSTIGTTANVIKQLRRNGVDCPILGGDTFDSTALMTSCSNYGRDVFFCSTFSDSDNTNLVSAEFVSKFNSWVKKDDERLRMNGNADMVSPQSALGYDSYMVLVDALSRAESLEPAAICTALAASNFEGTTGNISFDQTGGVVKKHTYIKCFDIENSTISVVQTSSVGE